MPTTPSDPSPRPLSQALCLRQIKSTCLCDLNTTHQSMDGPDSPEPSVAPGGRTAEACPGSLLPHWRCTAGYLRGAGHVSLYHPRRRSKRSSHHSLLITHHSSLTGRNEPRPRLAGVSSEDIVKLRVEVDLVSLQAVTTAQPHRALSDRTGKKCTHYAKSSSVPSTFVILTNWSALSCPWKNGSFRKICAVRKPWLRPDALRRFTMLANMQPKLHMSRL
jgi:hypothetical protein